MQASASEIEANQLRSRLFLLLEAQQHSALSSQAASSLVDNVLSEESTVISAALSLAPSALPKASSCRSSPTRVPYGTEVREDSAANTWKRKAEALTDRLITMRRYMTLYSSSYHPFLSNAP